MSTLSYLILTPLLGLAIGAASGAMAPRRQVVSPSKPRIRRGRPYTNSWR